MKSFNVERIGKQKVRASIQFNTRDSTQHFDWNKKHTISSGKGLLKF